MSNTTGALVRTWSIVAVLLGACVSGLFNPEFRCWLRLDDCSNKTAAEAQPQFSDTASRDPESATARQQVSPPGPPARSEIAPLERGFSLVIPNAILERVHSSELQFSKDLKIIIEVDRNRQIETSYEAASRGQPMVISDLSRGTHRITVTTEFSTFGRILADCQLVLSGSAKALVLVQFNDDGSPCHVRDTP